MTSKSKAPIGRGAFSLSILRMSRLATRTWRPILDGHIPIIENQLAAGKSLTPSGLAN